MVIVQFSEIAPHALSYLLVSKPPSRLKRYFKKLFRLSLHNFFLRTEGIL